MDNPRTPSGPNDPPRRDWDKELEKVDQAMAREAAPAPSAAPGRRAPGSDTAVPRLEREKLRIREWLGTWGRVALALLIGIGVAVWPYAYGCGLKLMFYLVAIAAVITAGIWSAIWSWRRHLGFAHVLSVILVTWGTLLAAREVLPRVGYAKHAATWFCPDTPPG
jgi:hypothetical protein